MSDIPPPTDPGWYADATGAWWWWDGSGWTPQVGPGAVSGGAEAVAAPARTQERTLAMVMWIVYLVGGSFIGAIVFYVVAKREKLFLRHHAAEALNLTVVLLVPQIVGFVLLAPAYIDWVSTTIDDPEAPFEVSGGFWAGLALVVATSLLTYGFAIAGAVQASRGRWWRLPIGLHPVRGVVRKGEEPYSVT